VKPIAAAVVALAIAVTWLGLTVHYNDRDNWTALFYTGAQSTIPPQLGNEDVFQVPNSTGYDGQYYHYIAHDPFFRHGIQKYVDNPQMRYRRILIPALAYLLAAGNEDYVDSLYILVMLAFVGAGAYWLSRYAVLHDASYWIGLAFLLVPAVLVSLDRMTVDLALAALAIAFVLYAERAEWPKVYAVLTAAALVRETGLLFILAACIWNRRRAWKFALCAAPFFAWELFVRANTGGSDQTVLATFVPFSAIVQRTLHPVQFAMISRWLAVAAALDYLALLGVWVALGICAFLLWKRQFDLLAISALLFAAFSGLLGAPQIWADAYAFGRTLTPLFIWLALRSVAYRQYWAVVPVAMVIPRIIFQFQPQWKGIIHELFG
jgi:FtsH-binding integral membrane protein